MIRRDLELAFELFQGEIRVLRQHENTEAVMHVRVVWILGQQRVESSTSLLQATRRHVYSRLPGDENLLSLWRRNFLRQERHPQHRQSESFYDLRTIVTNAQ